MINLGLGFRLVFDEFTSAPMGGGYTPTINSQKSSVISHVMCVSMSVLLKCKCS